MLYLDTYRDDAIEQIHSAAPGTYKSIGKEKQTSVDGLEEITLADLEKIK